MIVKLIYDHRVLDGAYIARRLRDIESAMNGPILDELLQDQVSPGSVPKPHLRRPVPNPGLEARTFDQSD